MILAIDTSGRSGSIALVEDGRLVAERTVGDAGPHARWLLGNIDGICSAKGIALTGIRLFAVAVGPGSFTGLRIGLTTIKGLAWSLDKPVTPVSTLSALAMNACTAGVPVCPMLDARKSEVYTGLYTFRDGEIKTLMEPISIRPEIFLKKLNDEYPEPAPVFFLGNGLGPYGDLVRKARKGTILTPEPLWHVRASNIAALALSEGAESTTALELAPLYLRKSEAEIRLKARQSS